MSITRRMIVVAALSGAAAIGLQSSAASQEMPSGTLRIIVPFPAGSMVTNVARVVVPDLERELGRTIVVENMPGAGTVIATEHVLRQPPDGRTILMMSNSFFVNRSLRPNLSYDPLTDFQPVSLAASLSHLLVAPPTFEGGILEFLAAAEDQSRPPLRYGAGTGTSNHLLSVEFARSAGLDALHIPYSGGAPTYVDVMGGRLDFVFASIGDGISYASEGNMTPLAVAGPARVAALPDVPTLEEVGIDVTLTDAVYGAVIPSAVPAEITARWQAAFAVALANPEVRATIEGWSLSPGEIDAAAFGQMIVDYEAIAGGIVRELGLEAGD